MRLLKLLWYAIPPITGGMMFMAQVGPEDAVSNLAKWWIKTGWPAPQFVQTPNFDRWVFWLSALSLVAWGSWAAWFLFIRSASPTRLPAGHETDASKVLAYLLHRTRWADSEHRKINIREFVNHLGEFRRAARDDGLHTSGIPNFGGRREPIEADHWIVAAIDPESANVEHGVRTKSEISNRSYNPPQTYGSIKVLSMDVERLWPRATAAGRLLTRAFIQIKLIGYACAIAWESERRVWHTIRDNVRSEAATRDDDLAQSTIEPQRPWPDFDRWDSRNIMRMFEAACLWCDETPGLPMPSAARPIFERLRNAIYEDRLSGLLSVNESVRVAFGKHMRRQPPETDPVTVNTLVSRDSLMEYAERVNETPRFLFPGARSL